MEYQQSGDTYIDTDNLKSCPFCGYAAGYRKMHPMMNKPLNLDKSLCKCSNRMCNASKIFFYIDQWNRRA